MRGVLSFVLYVLHHRTCLRKKKLKRGDKRYAITTHTGDYTGEISECNKWLAGCILVTMKRPLMSVINSLVQKTQASTFAQVRAEKYQERLQKAISERRNLYRAEAAADAPLDATLHERGEVVGRKIGRLQEALKTDE